MMCRFENVQMGGFEGGLMFSINLYNSYNSYNSLQPLQPLQLIKTNYN